MYLLGYFKLHITGGGGGGEEGVRGPPSDHDPVGANRHTKFGTHLRIEKLHKERDLCVIFLKNCIYFISYDILIYANYMHKYCFS